MGAARENMNANVSITLPHPEDREIAVKWNGEAFELDNEHLRVLAYDVSPSGWDDDLTHLHEEAGGSDHFIDVASRRHALSEAKRAAGETPSVVLEVGVSSGFLLAELLAELPRHIVIGADYTRDTLERLGRRLKQVPLIQFDLTDCPLPDEFANVAILLNVLEHVGDDRAAAAELFRILRPGGRVIIEVPAGPDLYDVYDQALMHFRRYDLAGLSCLLEEAGFVIERKSHLGVFLYPAFYLSKRLNQVRYGGENARSPQTVAARQIAATKRAGIIGRSMMWLEDALRPHVGYTRGIRCLVTAVKPIS